MGITARIAQIIAIMLSLATVQTTAFAGAATGASTFQPMMKAAKAADFAYGLPGNFNIFGGARFDFDPLGFLDGKSELEVNRFRECELTHGRVAMLASLGFIVQEKFHPLFSGGISPG